MYVPVQDFRVMQLLITFLTVLANAEYFIDTINQTSQIRFSNIFILLQPCRTHQECTTALCQIVAIIYISSL